MSTPTPPPAPDHNAMIADRIVASASSSTAREAAFGTLLVLISFFTTPWFVLSRSVTNLATWGAQRALPTQQSELPVLTFFTIIARPLLHLLWAIGWVLYGLYKLFEFGSYSYQFPSALMLFMGCQIVAYFGQYWVGLTCESISVIVRIANDIQKLAARDR